MIPSRSIDSRSPGGDFGGGEAGTGFWGSFKWVASARLRRSRPEAAIIRVVAAPVALEIEVESARQLIDAGVPLLDVRDAAERARLRIAGSLWIPIEELSDRWQELPREGTLVVQCSAGSRSFRATKFLREKGLVATSMIGGLSEWLAHGLPTVTESDSPGRGTPSRR